MIRDLVAIGREMWAKARKRRADRLLVERKVRLAHDYNTLHTATTRFNVANGRWMCPRCHSVHRAIEWSPLTGAQYPACCQYPTGHRCFV